MSNNTNYSNGRTKRKYSVIDSIDLTTDVSDDKKIKFDEQPSTSTARLSPEPLMLPNSSYYYKHVPSISEILELDEGKQTNKEKKELSEDEVLTRRKLSEKEFNYDSGPVKGLIWWKQTCEKINIIVEFTNLKSPTSKLDVMMNTNGFKITLKCLSRPSNLLTTTFFKTVEDKKWDVENNGHILKMEFQKSAPEFWSQCFLILPKDFYIMEYDILCSERHNLDETTPREEDQKLLNKKAALKELLSYVTEDYKLMMSTDQNITNLSSDTDSSTAALTKDLLNVSQPSLEPQSDKEDEIRNSPLVLKNMSTDAVTDLSNDTGSTKQASSYKDSLNKSQCSLESQTGETINSTLALPMSVDPITEDLFTGIDNPTTVSSTEVSLITPQSTVKPLVHSKEDIENALLIMQLSMNYKYVDPAINTEISTKASSTDISPAILQSSLEPLLQQNKKELDNSQLALQISTESFTVDPATIIESPTKASNEVPPIISNSCYDNEHYKIAAGLSFDSELTPPTFP